MTLFLRKKSIKQTALYYFSLEGVFCQFTVLTVKPFLQGHPGL